MENRCNIKAKKQAKQKPQYEELCTYQYADMTAEKNKLKKTKSTQKQASANPEQQAKLMTVALLAKSPHNSEAVAIFEVVDGDSEFISQHFNSSQMQTEQT